MTDADLITRLLDDELLTLQTLRDAADRIKTLSEQNQALRLSIFTLRAFLQEQFGWDIYDWADDEIKF